MRRTAMWLVGLAVGGFAVSLAVVGVATWWFASQGLGPARSAQADVILVLSAGLDRDKAALDPFSTERVRTAVALWREGVAPTIVMSGGVDEEIGQHVGERMKDAAVGMGAPEFAVAVEGVSSTTFENARFTLDLARREGWRSAVVVSDDFHLLRAQALFTFWREEDDLEIVALAPARGRARAGARAALWMVGREALAGPYNVGKVAGQVGLELLGLGDERMIR